MKSWEKYLGKRNPEYTMFQLAENYSADIIVVIPCYNEPNLFETLHSLLICSCPKANVLVAVIFNSGEQSDEEGVKQNRISYEEMKAFAEKKSAPGFQFVSFNFENLPRKHAGVGLARKIGMDLAVKHFLETGKSQGIIVSLDADCLVSENYLTRIHQSFRKNPKLCATIHNFHHRVENNDTEIEKAIRQYETYIRYFSESLKFTGFPYFYHTIGSAFAVSADAYVRAGGMGRQQGGEDFYFLQKVFELGAVEELNDVFVYPMARFSDRVPFGTGPALQKIMAEPDGEMKVYSPHAFLELKKLFDTINRFFEMKEHEIQPLLLQFHPAIANFLESASFHEALMDCKRNCATYASFRKRFFHHFNAFKIIKYLNFAHPAYFSLMPLKIALEKSAQ